MTHRDESAKADADLGAPSTRRSRRDGEREAAHRALYADSTQPASSMRVVDGGSPMYRTRREMRESASRLARDLPVIVEPALEVPADADEAPVEPSAADEPTQRGRRARRIADDAARSAEPTTPVAETVVEQAAPVAEPIAPTSRRARRLAAPASPEQTPVVEQAEPAAQAPVAEQAEPAAQAPLAVEPVASAPAPTSRRARRAATQPVVAPAAWSELVAASTPQDERVDASAAEPLEIEDSSEAPVATTEQAVEVVEREAVEEPTLTSIVEQLDATHETPSAQEPVAAREPEATDRVVTRAEHRAAQAASSDEVSAAVAAVLGGEQEDVASTPVRSPLRREARAPRPATVARRPIAHAPVVRPSRRARSGAARKAMQRLAAAGVILSIGSFVAVTSLPAQAFSPAEQSSTTGAYGDVEVEQQLDVTTGSGAHGSEEVTAVLTRDDFGVDDALASARLSADELASLQSVADAEDIGPYYGGDPAMPGVWAQLETTYTQSPFPSLAEVPVSSGFGYRWGSFHGGVDLIPGAGTPVFPVANGVVVATWQGNNPGGGGYEVIVEHNIDGEYFQSWYPHMQAGSIQVEPGQVVDITTQLGQVGSTGRSTGAHLHLEIKNGDYISVDPLVWLATREQILEP